MIANARSAATASGWPGAKVSRSPLSHWSAGGATRMWAFKEPAEHPVVGSE